MFKCHSCNWIVHTPKKKSKNKVQYNSCPNCENIVHSYVMPLKDRVGRCGNCGNGSFSLKVFNSYLLRECKNCEEVVNTDNLKVVEEGIKQDDIESV